MPVRGRACDAAVAVGPAGGADVRARATACGAAVVVGAAAGADGAVGCKS